MFKSIVKTGNVAVPKDFSSFTSALLEPAILTSALALAMHSRMVFPGTFAAISLEHDEFRRPRTSSALFDPW